MITEDARHELHDALRSTIGTTPALTLMHTLPPIDWSDVATKQDLGHLEERMDLRLAAFEDRTNLRFAHLEENLVNRVSSMLDQRIAGLIFKLVFAMLTLQVAFAGLVLTLLQEH